MKPSCVICISAHLPSLRLLVVAFRENRVLESCLRLLPSPQPCHDSLIRKVLATWLFGLSSMKMAGPLRGHAWPGDVPAPPSSQWQDLCRSVIVAASLLTSHFHVLCYRLLLCTEEITHDQNIFPSGERSSPTPRVFCSSSQEPPHTSSLASVCYTHPWG